ncbi:MAG: hypothetical protein V3T22_14435, partial [Planctomycetota bacterium]
MEALALLCTLHADGPLTLRRLRRAGCGSLEQLEALEPQDLASLLEVTPAVARRLGKEARVLAQRLDLVFEDREEGGEQAVPPAVPLAVPPAGAAPSPSIEAVEPCAPSGGRLDSHERKILGAVLERSTTPAPGDVPAQEASHPSTIQATPADPHSSEFSGLVAGCIDGLDEATAGRLAELGIADLDSLAEWESLPLAQDLAVPFAQVRRLQFLARQAARLEASESAAIPLALPIAIPDPVQMAPAPPRPSEPSPEALDEPITEPIPDSEV